MFSLRRVQRSSKRLLYGLKRRFGLPIIYTNVVEGAFDPITGDTTISTVSVKIPLAITLTHETRDLIRGVTNAGFGNLLIGDRLFIVSRDDLSLEPTQTDYIVLDNKQFTIIKLIELEYQAGYVFHCRTVTKTKVPYTETFTYKDQMVV